ncbi:hypothetical protein UL82_09485 [Corynebacterium kutscheri]|uniref:Uncharacterized protein n=1 Tax=Corynebacterium kutscheri TaxID=35755 RepID=A0A0F6R1S3_9CORY|nr:hypothetical protein UL82_09485 [Corynebacterium kutscheri]VEH10376.1 Uncharacterised protein [Corynebacterium kutscheri]
MHEDDRCQAEHAGDRQRQQHSDDRQGQHDVLVDDPAAAAGVAQSLRDEAKVVAGEGDVGGLDRGVGAGRAHRDAHGRPGQGGRVVDAVADHRGRRRLREPGDDASLVLGTQLGVHVADPGQLRQRSSGAGVVASEHAHLDALVAQGPHDLGDLGAQLVADADRPGQEAVDGDEHAGLPLGLQVLDPGLERTGVDPARTAHRHPAAVDQATDAVPGLLGHVLRGGGSPARGGDGGGEWVRRVLLHGGSPSKHLRIVEPMGGDDGGYLGPVAGQSAGLVHGQVPDAAEALEGGPALDDDAELGRRADRGDHGDGHRDRQRAGAGRDEDDQGAGDPGLRVAEQGPEHADEDGEDHHAGHQRAGDPVSDPGSVALLGLGLLYQLHDRGQRVVGARGGRLDLQHAGAVDRARRHRFSGRDLDRDRFTGDRRSVQARPARADQPIGRDPLARADQQHVADGDLPGRDRGGDPVAQHGRGLRHELQQRAQPAAGAVHRLVLQGLGDRVEERQRGRLLDVAEDHRAHGADRHQQRDPELALHNEIPDRTGHERVRAQQQARPERDQRRDVQPRPLQRQAGAERDAGEDRHDQAGITPPRALCLLCLVRGAGRRLVAAAGGAHEASPELLAAQQPGTEQAGSMHGALSSTARVTSTSAVSAAARCGSAIS